MIINKISRWMLYDVMKWNKIITEEHPSKYIICLAPHTSNLDFFIGQLYMRAENLRVNFLMKKEWFFWPLGILAKSIGGIPVYRSKKMRMTEQLAEVAKNSDHFCLTITPEGTRSLSPNWKNGFYYIALNAKIPILLYGVDYTKKVIQCTRTIYPSGDIEKDMKEIKQYFKDFKGKYPHKFTIG